MHVNSEPEVEGDGSRVVVAIRKGETDLFKKVAQKMEEAGANDCSYMVGSDQIGSD